MMKKSLGLNKEIVIAFVNVEKGFDKVVWNTTFRVLRVDYRGRGTILLI